MVLHQFINGKVKCPECVCGMNQKIVICWQCEGTGLDNIINCHKCKGNGRLLERTEVTYLPLSGWDLQKMNERSLVGVLDEAKGDPKK